MENSIDVGPAVELSERQRQVLDLVCHGLNRTEIAEQLGVRPLTVATHVKNIYRKLNVNNRAGAVAVALSRGLIEFSQSRLS
jgi:DNA-binding NarL/FixJ family response regulator